MRVTKLSLTPDALWTNYLKFQLRKKILIFNVSKFHAPRGSRKFAISVFCFRYISIFNTRKINSTKLLGMLICFVSLAQRSFKRFETHQTSYQAMSVNVGIVSPFKWYEMHLTSNFPLCCLSVCRQGGKPPSPYTWGIKFPLSTFRSLVLLFVRRRLSRGCMSILFNFTQRAGCDKSTCSPPPQPRPRTHINYKTGAQLHAALSLALNSQKSACMWAWKNTLFVCVVRRKCIFVSPTPALWNVTRLR